MCEPREREGDCGCEDVDRWKFPKVSARLKLPPFFQIIFLPAGFYFIHRVIPPPFFFFLNIYFLFFCPPPLIHNTGLPRRSWPRATQLFGFSICPPCHLPFPLGEAQSSRSPCFLNTQSDITCREDSTTFNPDQKCFLSFRWIDKLSSHVSLLVSTGSSLNLLPLTLVRHKCQKYLQQFASSVLFPVSTYPKHLLKGPLGR